jgi:hypothetical protein
MDEVTFASIIEQNYSRVLRSALVLTGNIWEPEDLAQETFLEALRSRSRFAGRSQASTWLHAILFHLHRRRLRSGQRRKRRWRTWFPRLSRSATEAAELGQPIVTAACTGLRHREVADGIVAATDRAIPRMPCDLLQTDAFVGPMSAGRPLVDIEGRLVGIVVAKEGPDAQQRGPVRARHAPHAASWVPNRAMPRCA